MPKMHMQAAREKNRKKYDFDIGKVKTWDFKGIDSMSLEYHTLYGGVERIVEDKYDRVLIVDQGMATNLENKQIIREGYVIEIPAGTTFHLKGQLKYYLIKQHR